MMRRLAPLLLALAASASAQEQLIREVTDPKTDTHVEITSLFSEPPSHGYLPVRVTIANRLESNRSVTVSFECNTNGSYRDEGSKMTSSFTFDAPAEKSSDHDILVPLPTAIGGRGTGTSVKTTLSGTLGNSSHTLSGEFAENQPGVLMGEKLYTANALDLSKEAGSHLSTYRGSVTFASRFDARRMPDDWRAYSGYDHVIMTDDEWTTCSPGAKTALLAWIRLGGHLRIYTSTGTATGLNLPVDTSFGSVKVEKTSGGALKLDAPAVVNAILAKGPRSSQLESINNDYNARWPLQDDFGKVGFNYAVFIVILIAFGVVVGPVNLFVFAKTGRRHRLFITTPLISLAASLLLVILILLQDGFGGRGVRVALMEVRPDNSENAAYIHQEQFSRTGVLTGVRFTLQDAAVISPVPIAEDNRWARLTTTNGGGGNGYSANFVDGKLETAGDWFQSRSEQGQILEAVIPTRGRIERATGGGDPSLLSTFDFPIETLLFRDDSKQWWKATNVQPGSRIQPVTITDAEANGIIDIEKGRLGNRNANLLDKVKLRDGSFIATTLKAPAVETYKSIKWQQTRTVITGPVIIP
ncbi:hypothetical protein KBB96_11380 [Luteolibacter ambystomatis]|uniref:Uncharacterized protein n=1 Tax=Luteolibacter ambystomatis TaxID=2824561 RepID=A0A975G525_9BACT|nr:hypothetical protein [Luteolibacter ambystomatis]QUE49474.1 hypothetical protein KBB96_11380 [Luteolibacter ambystomatis]